MKQSNVLTLNDVLANAKRHSYALGSFSPRYTSMIKPVLRAGQKTQSPLIVQISHNELVRYGITPVEFAEEFFTVLSEENITVPVVLHLDHTKLLSVIKDAIAAGFTSVMIDASEKTFAENIGTSKEAVEYGHAKYVSVEAELGRIGTTDFVETGNDEELFTDPGEALQFVNETKCDALAVSVGTAHGVYSVRQPRIDIDRLKAIRALTSVHLVLHGGSGVPSEMIKKAIALPNGGISKVNIATDLELALLKALGREDRMTNEECQRLAKPELEAAQNAVEQAVTEKIRDFLGSAGQARFFTI